MALLVLCATASAQTFNPPPVRTAGAAAGLHTVELDLGWAQISHLDLDFNFTSIPEFDFSYRMLPTLNVAYDYGISDRFRVGAHAFAAPIDFDDKHDDDPATAADEADVDYASTFTLDAFASYAVLREERWAAAPFLAVGMTHTAKFHVSLGVIADVRVAEGWTISPYAQVSSGIYEGDFDGGDIVEAFRYGINVTRELNPELSLVMDIAMERQSWDVTVRHVGIPGSTFDAEGTGTGFALEIGVRCVIGR